MKTFLRVIEVWVPSPDGSLLEFGGGVFGSATTLRAISRFMCFGRAEGLPGRVWESEQPVLLPQLEGSTYRRSAAAQAAGLGCAVGVPLFAGEALASVLVLYGAAEARPGAAMELWSRDDRGTGELSRCAGCYLGGAAPQESAAHRARPGAAGGLADLALQRGQAVCVDDPADASLLRSDEAAGAAWRHGLAFACAERGGRQQVVTLSSAAAVPIARRIESWAIDGASVRRRGAHGEGAAHDAAPWAIAAIESAFDSGRPSFVEAESGAGGRSFDTELAAIPIAAGGAVGEVLALYL